MYGIENTLRKHVRRARIVLRAGDGAGDLEGAWPEAAPGGDLVKAAIAALVAVTLKRAYPIIETRQPATD